MTTIMIVIDGNLYRKLVKQGEGEEIISKYLHILSLTRTRPANVLFALPVE